MNLIRRFAEQGAYTAGQTTAPVPRSRRLVGGKAALDKAQADVGKALDKATRVAAQAGKTAAQAGKTINAQKVVVNKAMTDFKKAVNKSAGPLTLARMKTMYAKDLKEEPGNMSNYKALKDLAATVGCADEVKHEARLFKIRDAIVEHARTHKLLKR